jgi:hypothetical protein
MGLGGENHDQAGLPPGMTPDPLFRRLGGPQGRSRRARKISSPIGIRSPDRPARSESLYLLQCSATHGSAKGNKTAFCIKKIAAFWDVISCTLVKLPAVYTIMVDKALP